MRVNGKDYRSVWWERGLVRMIDQRRLPHQFAILDCPRCADTVEAIRDMAVRGAGAIGVAAGYAAAQATHEAPASDYRPFLEQAAAQIRRARPTAQDLFFAVDRVMDAALSSPSVEAARQAARRVAEQLADDNARAGEQIGRVGAELLREGMRILTHCNAGWLAFADWGSALAPIYQAHRRGMKPFVYVDETRPRSQGAKLTAWELGQEGVPHAILVDAAAGSLMRQGRVDVVIVGADRIAANGDVANKIGTYPLAVLAQRHHIPFYVAAPRSTFDLATPTGAEIPIEERSPEEVCDVVGQAPDGRQARVRISPEGSGAINPAFDVTPAELITALITDEGLIRPEASAIAALASGQPARLSA